MSKHTVKNENIRFNRAGYRSDDEMNESRMMKYATNNTPIVMISKSGMNILVQGLTTFYNGASSISHDLRVISTNSGVHHTNIFLLRDSGPGPLTS